jgi:hypothetical protein
MNNEFLDLIDSWPRPYIHSQDMIGVFGNHGQLLTKFKRELLNLPKTHSRRKGSDAAIGRASRGAAAVDA